MKKITVIIPVYNVEESVGRCVESIINQTYKNLEIILVNDGSGDNSSLVCKQYEEKDKRIKLINKENGGPSSARNVGIKNASGDFIFFMDSDDFIDRNVLKDLVNNFTEKELVGVMHNDVKNDVAILNKYNNCYNRDEFIINILNNNIFGGIWGYLYETQKVKNINFDENTNYLEDTLFLMNYLQKNKIKKIKFIENNDYYNYVLNNNSITGSKKNALKKIKSICYSLEEINKITDKQYSDYVLNKKVILLEKEMRNFENKKELVEILDYIGNIEFKGNSIRYKIFCKMINNKRIKTLIVYYKIREVLKKIKNGGF